MIQPRGQCHTGLSPDVWNGVKTNAPTTTQHMNRNVPWRTCRHGDDVCSTADVASDDRRDSNRPQGPATCRRTPSRHRYHCPITKRRQTRQEVWKVSCSTAGTGPYHVTMHTTLHLSYLTDFRIHVTVANVVLVIVRFTFVFRATCTPHTHTSLGEAVLRSRSKPAATRAHTQVHTQRQAYSSALRHRNKPAATRAHTQVHTQRHAYSSALRHRNKPAATRAHTQVHTQRHAYSSALRHRNKPAATRAHTQVHTQWHAYTI